MMFVSRFESWKNLPLDAKIQWPLHDFQKQYDDCCSFLGPWGVCCNFYFALKVSGLVYSSQVAMVDFKNGDNGVTVGKQGLG